MAASASFSSSFVTSCRFWLAANSIWATLVVAACVTVGCDFGWSTAGPLSLFFIVLSTGLVIRELWKSKLRVKTLLILLLGLASTGFPLWPCLIKGAFISVAGDTFFYSYFRSISRRSSPGIRKLVCRRSINLGPLCRRPGLAPRLFSAFFRSCLIPPQRKPCRSSHSLF